MVSGGKHLALWEEAFENGKAVRDQIDQLEVLISIVKGYCELGAVEKVWDAIRTVSDEAIRAQLLVHMASLNHMKDGDQIITEALGIIAEMDVDIDQRRDGVRKNIVEILCDYGYPEKAHEIGMIIEWQNNEHGRLTVLERIAKGYAQNGLWGKAFEVLEESSESQYQDWRHRSTAFIDTIVEWGMSWPIVVDVVRIMGWERRLWRQVYERVGR